MLELAELGAQFTRGAGGSLHLTREGGHSARRIVHAADVTGREIERALLAAAAAEGNITFFKNHLAVDLVWDEVRSLGTAAGLLKTGYVLSKQHVDCGSMAEDAG